MENVKFVELLDELTGEILSPEMSDIRNIIEKYKNCRTIKMGGRIVECPNCKEKMVLYNPCNKRGCPVCGKKNQLQWKENIKCRLLEMGHYHLVIVPPDMYTMIWMYHKHAFISSLFNSINESFKKYQKKKGLQYGMTMVFQSVGEGLSYHPHVHCIITPGGMNDEHEWEDDFSMNYSEILEEVKKSFSCGFLKKLPNDAKKRYRMIDNFTKDEWGWNVTFHQNSGESIVNYLSKSACGTVVNPEKEIEWDRLNREIIYQPTGKKITRLRYEVFMERFFNHIPPKGIVLVRNYGLYSNRHKEELIELKEKFGFEVKKAEEYEEECPKCNTEMKVLYQFSYEDIPEIIKEYLRINKSPPEHECSLETA